MSDFPDIGYMINYLEKRIDTSEGEVRVRKEQLILLKYELYKMAELEMRIKNLEEKIK